MKRFENYIPCPDEDQYSEDVYLNYMFDDVNELSEIGDEIDANGIYDAD